MEIPFACPDCGSEQFKTTVEPETYAQLLGAICIKCGRAVTEEDIMNQGRKIADALVKDILLKNGLGGLK